MSLHRTYLIERNAMGQPSRLVWTGDVAMPVKRHKYGAQPTVVDGVRFASKKESRRYQELKLLVLAGEIRDLELQPRYRLTCANTAAGEVYHVGDYVADFRYNQRDIAEPGGWRPVVEDVKGVKTALYSWKKRHAQFEYGIVIQEI
jgi:hypothetical protein